MNHSRRLRICLSTVASERDADEIALLLLERSLAACVQIEGPIVSLYQWEGRMHKDEEYRLVIKTSSDAWPALKETLSEIHPYDEPQIVLLEVLDATAGYRDWVWNQTRSRGSEQ